MNTSEIKNNIINILAETTQIQRENIDDSSHLEADLGLDSISMASLITKFEPYLSDKDANGSLLESLIGAETVNELVTIICKNQ